MSSRRSIHTSVALGLYGSKDAWQLVKVRRDGEQFIVLDRYSTPRRGINDQPGEIASLIQQLPEDDRKLPIGLVLADGVGIYRRINAPVADDAILDKVVAAQVETMLPGGAEQVRWGWHRAGSDDSLWVHAATQTELNHVLSAMPAGLQPASIIADTMAAARFLIADDDSHDSKLCLAVGTKRSALILVAKGALIQVSEFDGGAEAIRHEDAEDWSHHLRDLRDELLSSLPPDQRPGNCQCMCAPDSRERVMSTAEQALGMPVQRWSLTGDIKGADTNNPAVMLAASAAASCMTPKTPTIRIVEDADTGSLDQRIRKYAFAAGTWLVIALCLLYASDRYRAAQVNNLLAEGTLEKDQLSQLDKQIGVANYLEQSGPIPLAIMDEIGQKVPGYMFEAFSYERDGSIKLSGLRKDGDQIGKLTNDLAGMQTLTGVQLQGQTRAGKEFKYEIVATAKPTFFGAFVQPPAKDEPEQDAEKNEGEV